MIGFTTIAATCSERNLVLQTRWRRAALRCEKQGLSQLMIVRVRLISVITIAMT